MTTLRYKMFETFLRLTGAGKTIGKGLAKGNIPSAKVPSGVRKRWAQSEFQGRDIFTCLPVGKGNGRVYVHQHGGAYVLGLNTLQFGMFTKMADMSGVTIILADYPLPPDETAEAIIDWAAAHYQSVVVQYGAESVMLGGDSAGGNLALAMSQKTPVAGPLVLLSPWVDLVPEDMADDIPNAEILLDPVTLKAAGRYYVGETDPKDPLMSPVFADPNDLPEVAIFAGEKDLLFGQIMKFSDRMSAAGKLAKLAVYGEFGHYWMFYPVPDRESTLIEIAAILARGPSAAL